MSFRDKILKNQSPWGAPPGGGSNNGNGSGNFPNSTFNIANNAGTAVITALDNGNVGIGTSSPNSYSGYTGLTLNGTTGSLVDLEVNGTVTGELYSDVNNGVGIQAVGSRHIQFKTNNVERMRIDSAGNLLLGTTSHSTGAFGASTGINVKKPRPQVLLQDTTNNTDAYFGLTDSGVYLATQDAIIKRAIFSFGNRVEKITEKYVAKANEFDA